MFQDAIIALRILHAQVQVNSDQIGVAGMSQGGGMSIWLGAWCSLVKSVCSDMPFMCGMGDSVLNYAYRYPLKELADFMQEIPIGEERVMNTISYYDTIFQAEYCQVPTHVTVGLKDPSSRVPNVQSMFEALPGKKHLETIDVGHDWHPSMILNTKRWFFQTL
jgi:cephalosporin-C deacetylase